MTASSELNDHVDDNNEGVDEMPAADIDASFVAEPRPNIAGVELDGESVLLVEGTTKPHWLNQTATIVWSCLDGEVTLDELAGEIAEAFGAEHSGVRDDVIALVQEMGRAGLLQGVAEEQPQPQAYEAPEGLPLGDDLPSFDGPSLDGGDIGLDDLRGRKLLLINWSATCGFCRKIAQDLAELKPDLDSHGFELVLLTYGTPEDNRELLEWGGLECKVVLQEGMNDVFGPVGTPAAYLVDEDGKVASKLAVGALDVPVLAKEAAGRDGSPDS